MKLLNTAIAFTLLSLAMVAPAIAAPELVSVGEMHIVDPDLSQHLPATSAGYALVVHAGETSLCLANADDAIGYTGTGKWVTEYTHSAGWNGYGRASCQWADMVYLSESELADLGMIYRGIEDND